MKKLGLLGRNITYSFSKKYFTEKFIQQKLILEYSYENFDIQNITEFPKIIKNNLNLIGLNVTIPYKEAILPFLDELTENANNIGAVNTIKILPNGKLLGDNTDFYGFYASLQPLLQPHYSKALILGTGGASKAIAYALKKSGIESQFISRTASENTIAYTDLTKIHFENHQIIINCTPLGTFPNVSLFPDIPYQFLTVNHLVFDLIYNPEKTMFLQKAENQGAVIKNGYDMLVFQAEKAWEVWNS